MQTFFDGLRLAALTALGEIHVIGVFPAGWSNKEVRVLRELLTAEVLCEADLHQVVHGRICEMGRASYEEHRVRGEYPDHTRSPEALAYALSHNVFTPREERRIEFDHGDTKESFIRSYENNIRESVVKGLLTERKPSVFASREPNDFCLDH